MGCIVARRSLALILAGLFIYKAAKEFSLDPLWALIYVLVGLEYLIDTRS
ncbi:hypothetical protein [Hyperthermus butylicus]|nr:hypothetical protein [Hyperthermus butylicus]